jgi:hypothetical protein
MNLEQYANIIKQLPPEFINALKQPIVLWTQLMKVKMI